MKKRYILGGIVVLLVLVILASSMSNSTSKEVKVGVINATSDTALESLEIPDNATSIRVVYNLTADNDYGIDDNGNLGTSSSFQAGQDPFMNGLVTESQYLVSGGNKTLNGEFTFSPNKYVVYSGTFRGKITVYATE